MAASEADRALGERVLSARKRRGMSQRLLAERAGLGRDAVRRLEGGKSKAHKSTILAVAGALGLSYADLTAEDGDLSPPTAPSVADVPAQAQRPGRRVGDGYITVYVADRSLEEVLEEVRERYEDKILAARARADLAEDPDPEQPEME